MKHWTSTAGIVQKKYTCSFCDTFVAPAHGYTCQSGEFLAICPNCNKPTYIDVHANQFPGVSMGVAVSGISDPEVANLYTEARRCASVNAYTASVMACRKILMNVSVHQGADQNKTFGHYVDYLESKGFVPPNGKGWVDEIRKRGNTATHEIKVMTKEDAELVLTFTAMLLRFVYELPSKLPKPQAP